MSDYDPFAPIYDEWAAGMTEDVPFYVELAREADGPIVELAVGTGRVAIPVARETGKRVIGIDLSPAMLKIARERVAEAGVDVELRRGDMRDFELGEPAALVYSPFRALLHLPAWHDRRRVLERVAAALRAGASHGTRSSSIRTSRRETTASRGRTRARRRCGSTSSTRPATTGST